MIRMSFWVLGLGAVLSATALACKPCDNLLEYSIRNNSVVLIGSAEITRAASPTILARNAKKSSMVDHESFDLGVRIQVEESLGASIGQNPKVYAATLRYSPPCKDFVQPVTGKRYLFFPEDHGNCSKFLFEIREGLVSGKTLEWVRARIAEKKLSL